MLRVTTILMKKQIINKGALTVWPIIIIGQKDLADCDENQE